MYSPEMMMMESNDDLFLMTKSLSRLDFLIPKKMMYQRKTLFLESLFDALLADSCLVQYKLDAVTSREEKQKDMKSGYRLNGR